MPGSFFAKKVLVAEVTRGLDLEHRVYLSGTRISVGSGPKDDLHLSDPEIVPGQLVFEKPDGEKAWSFHSSDNAETRVNTGNGRTGRVKPGAVFTLSPYTQITLRRVPMPAELRVAPDGKKEEIPLSVAVPGLVAAGVAALFLSGSLGDQATAETAGLATDAWFDVPARFGHALQPCLDSALRDAAARRVPQASEEAAFQTWLVAARDGTDAQMDLAALRKTLGHIIVDAQLAMHAGAYQQAIDRLATMERHLPLPARDCPVIAAIQSDISKLEARF